MVWKLLVMLFFSGSAKLSESSLLVVCDLTSPQSAELCAGMWVARWARELLPEEVREGQSQVLTYEGGKELFVFPLGSQVRESHAGIHHR